MAIVKCEACGVSLVKGESMPHNKAQWEYDAALTEKAMFRLKKEVEQLKKKLNQLKQRG